MSINISLEYLRGALIAMVILALLVIVGDVVSAEAVAAVEQCFPGCEVLN